MLFIAHLWILWCVRCATLGSTTPNGHCTLPSLLDLIISPLLQMQYNIGRIICGQLSPRYLVCLTSGKAELSEVLAICVVFLTEPKVFHCSG